MKDVGSIRRSQIVSTFGPGAIVDFRLPSGALLSGVMQGLDAWDGYSGPNKGLQDPNLIREPRLESKLGVKGFRPPPIGHYKVQNEDRERVLPVERFPGWQSCPECHVIQRSDMWGPSKHGDSLHCTNCSDKPTVVPVRFVTVCANGHLDDFGWDRWVEHRDSCSTPRLRLITVGAGIAGLRVECMGCKASRSMAEAFSPNGIPGQSCQGRRPWLRDRQADCSSPARITQRGASNVYFPVTESAISLPDWRTYFADHLGSNLNILEQFDDAEILLSLVLKLVMPTWERSETADEIVAMILKMRSQTEQERDADIRLPEFDMLLTDTSGSDLGNAELLNVRQDIPEPLADTISWISSVERLREVRALTGFTRLKASVDGEPKPMPLSKQPKDWLPGVAVHGEGIFVALSEGKVSKWESDSAVRQHIEMLRETWITAKNADGETPEGFPEKLTARYLLVHTLAHALIARLSLESGYSSTSLRERLYVGPEMAGLLIYTSTPDADGTMGGLSRQARSERFEGLFLHALAAQELCSGDPLCSEGLAASGSSGNHAACHSCVFLPETSCESFNSFLDRSLLSASEISYFNEECGILLEGIK